MNFSRHTFSSNGTLISSQEIRLITSSKDKDRNSSASINFLKVWMTITCKQFTDSVKFKRAYKKCVLIYSSELDDNSMQL